MFLERGVAGCSFGSVPLAVCCVTFNASYIPDSELEVKGAGKILLRDITKRDQDHIVNIERLLLFSLKRKDAAKQMRIKDFF
jgi:hypothetical protein